METTAAPAAAAPPPAAKPDPATAYAALKAAQEAPPPPVANPPATPPKPAEPTPAEASARAKELARIARQGKELAAKDQQLEAAKKEAALLADIRKASTEGGKYAAVEKFAAAMGLDVDELYVEMTEKISSRPVGDETEEQRFMRIAREAIVAKEKEEAEAKAKTEADEKAKTEQELKVQVETAEKAKVAEVERTFAANPDKYPSIAEKGVTPSAVRQSLRMFFEATGDLPTAEDALEHIEWMRSRIEARTKTPSIEATPGQPAAAPPKPPVTVSSTWNRDNGQVPPPKETPKPPANRRIEDIIREKDQASFAKYFDEQGRFRR